MNSVKFDAVPGTPLFYDYPLFHRPPPKHLNILKYFTFAPT